MSEPLVPKLVGSPRNDAPECIQDVECGAPAFRPGLKLPSSLRMKSSMPVGKGRMNT